MKLDFLKSLLDLWKKYGDLAKDLIPIIRTLAGEVREEMGLDTAAMIADTTADKAELDALLAADLAAMESTEP